MNKTIYPYARKSFPVTVAVAPGVTFLSPNGFRPKVSYMRTFIFLIVLFLTSCEDKTTYCFECETAEAGQVTTLTRCDITEKEADDIEKAGTIMEDSGHLCCLRIEKNTICRKM